MIIAANTRDAPPSRGAGWSWWWWCYFRFLKQFTTLSQELAASLRWAAGKSSEDGFIPPGDDGDDDFAARPEPDPTGYTSPDPHDSDPGPGYSRKRPSPSHGRSTRSMSDDGSGSDCDSTHTPDSLDGSPDHSGWQPDRSVGLTLSR